MIDFLYETDFRISDELKFSDWISRVLQAEGITAGEITFVFCLDAYLLDFNKRFLGHDTLTDIITFQYEEGTEVYGDVVISVERVQENSQLFGTGFEQELLRVMAHGVLHLMGYKDKLPPEREVMRSKENEMMTLFHVEQL